MAHRFIVGESPRAALGVLRGLWDDGAASSVDLLGEATVTREEADRYAARCVEALDDARAAATRGWPDRPDAGGRLARARSPRVNLSVKVSALTPLMRPEAPEVGRDDAAGRLRPLLRRARGAGRAPAHRHGVARRAGDDDGAGLRAARRARVRATGPSAGVVLQAYLRESPAQLDRILDWARATSRTPPLTVRLVKGAYWDHEVVEARQHGWAPPVFEVKAESDRNFEELTARLLDARPLVRVAVASHNLRSVAHAIACNRAAGGEDRDLELQVLRGLGDELQEALAANGLRVRAYCPVGDLVAGMAYLVRRLLENTSNDSFLGEQQRGAPIDELLAAP